MSFLPPDSVTTPERQCMFRQISLRVISHSSSLLAPPSLPLGVVSVSRVSHPLFPSEQFAAAAAAAAPGFVLKSFLKGRPEKWFQDGKQEEEEEEKGRRLEGESARARKPDKNLLDNESTAALLQLKYHELG